ncbi:MAG: prepilin-type N-terminal cleavage/methylation domain-containing protein [Rhodanobacter sp.]|nr:MAG: prepilin-type N-terminal cleavage/methylation domain-containing protein [Rhodanobacter sp.]TAL90825.1 MAG: prepilin-type N-terminal cleavage/methylation domain-containing protein [Rhodanobacter sp.]TAM38734.1 MAG: prepilin-type N-terminal cleavage/methylation domain-containing protein [Rhodanobacter sp.]TAN23186.1 MAG: prepilin-type N-terminal cleavage/methylation domain-containing protein [Rhodanobacter sp.]
MIAMRFRSRGFSLLELMVTVAVVAILLAIAVPSFRGVIHRNQVSSASNALLASVNYARSEAITRGQLVSMCPGDKSLGCTAGSKVYDQGWIVYTYPAGAASANKAYVAASSILLRSTEPQTNVSIEANSGTIVTFGKQGQLKPSTPLQFATCYRSASSGTGTITTKVPGVELDVNGSGSVTSKAATTCSP